VWAVKEITVSPRHDTQAAVIQQAREIARNQGSELRIQRADGKFRAGWSYGNDRFRRRTSQGYSKLVPMRHTV